MRGTVIAPSTVSHAAPPRFAGTLLRSQPDDRLARLAGEGSEAAFEEIVRRYRSGLVAFAAKIASRDSADDVVQDSMVKAHSALLRGDRPDAPRAWLFRIVRNTALNDRRDRRAHERLDESYDGVEQPPEVADRRGQLRELVAAMSNLPRAQRLALVQRELEGRGHDEIAADLDISPGAVRQLIFRARAALRAGVGALLPMQLLRAAVLSGAAEQAGPVNAAGGAGIAAKAGIAALLTTGALVAGTHSVKDRESPAAHRQATVTKAAKSARAEAAPAVEHSGSVAGTHRRQVIVTPKRASTPRSAARPSRTAIRSPQSDRGGTVPRSGSSLPPAGSGGRGGPDGGHTDGGAGGVQNYSVPSPQDWQSDGTRDPAPTDGSPR